MVKRSPVQKRTANGRRLSLGQALVEFSLILPVFLLVFFGILEFALIMASVGAYNFAANDSARLGSLLGRTDPSADSEIVADIRAHVANLPATATTEIDIYRATSDGSCLTAPTGPASSTSVNNATCIKNQYDLNGNPIGAGVQWPVADRNDSLIDADYIGVRVLYSYTYLTSFISAAGTSLNLSAFSTQRIEPQDFQG